jgi:thiol-disulfide isomerase/thioredoxin
MSKRILVISLGVMFLSLVCPVAQSPASAQSSKPTKVLRQLQEDQLKLQEEFDRDVGDGKAQLYDWESRAELARKKAATELAGFQIGDWKGQELLALYSLYLQTEMFAQSIEAGQAYLKTDSKSRFAEVVQAGLIRSLVQLGKVEEAQKLLDDLFKEIPENSLQLATRVGLFKELTIAWRERGRYEMAAMQAKRGYDLQTNRGRLRELDQRTSDQMMRDRLSLAAEYIAAQERVGFEKEAKDFDKKFLKDAFDEQAILKSFYESELAAAHLMGNPAPEIEAPRWISSEPVKIASLRGKVVLLDFWAMWCSQCAGAFPQWQEFQKKFSGKGLEIIGVTKLFGRSDKEESLTREQELNALRSFKTAHQLNYPIAVGRMDDVTNEERYAIASLPTVVLIDRRGNVRHIKRGIGEYRKLENQLEKLINEH